MGMTLGQRVRSLRQQHAMSQQQLAGTELTRAFISLVEQDKCQPSTNTLQILARRLGKPVEYFLERQENDEVEAIEMLELASQRAMERGDLAAAVRSAVSAVRLSARIDNRPLELRSRRNLANVYSSTGDFERSLEQWEEVVDLCKQMGDRRGIAESHYHLGRCAHFLEEFGTAQRHYRKTLRLAEGKKSLRELSLQTAENLGNCWYRLGDYESAVRAYKVGLKTAQELGDEVHIAHGLSNIGAALVRLNQYQEACDMTQHALGIYERFGHRAMVQTRHNLAAIYLDLGRWEEARPILESCLDQYRERGSVVLQAYVREELARYWLAMNNPEEAEAHCVEAIGLLDLQDDGILRGRLYRMLGKVHLARGDVRRAEELLRVSLEILRRLKALDQVMETMAELGHTSSRYTRSSEDQQASLSGSH